MMKRRHSLLWLLLAVVRTDSDASAHIKQKVPPAECGRRFAV